MKKTAAICLIICMAFGMVVLSIFSNNKEIVAADGVSEQPFLQLGDYITLGKFWKDNGVNESTLRSYALIWRVVSQDENGLLLFSEKIITGMKFGKEGNNCWSDSYIRDWLNSPSETGKEEWRPYSREKHIDLSRGFLCSSNFTDSEKSVIKPVSQRNLLAPGYPGKVPQGGRYEAWDKRKGFILDPNENGYYEIAYEILADKVFLLDIKQMEDVYQNREVLGNFYQAKALAAAPRFANDDGSYYLRTPHVINQESTGGVLTGLTTGNSIRPSENEEGATFGSSSGVLGVRPAFYLNKKTAVILSGNGSKENPYVMDGTGESDLVVVVNEQILSFDQPPVKQDNRVLVPLRRIFEAMGVQVDWEETTKTITAQKGEIVVKLQVDSNEMMVNGQVIILDVPAIVINDRTLVPIRAISEAFHATVDWDEAFQMVTITN